jgi:hypothetical protein
MLLWFTGYLWSVPIALAVSSAANWQYDADLGFWIVGAYTAPVLLLSEPLQGSISLEAMAGIYFGCLVALTISVILHIVTAVRELDEAPLHHPADGPPPPQGED